MKFKTECIAREKFNHSYIIILLLSTGKRGNATKNGTYNAQLYIMHPTEKDTTLFLNVNR